MILAAIFWAKNKSFAKQLQTIAQEDKTTQNILKEMSLEDVKGFTKKNKFLIF